ncbi:hypothetical protein B0T16DRAFT_460313 [Cercophora newfieldiana]|uniref:Uncharacterized protein n=1 Tax=Cercophora newfieldiana TaxID=92897 RepID=A0AA39Y1E8_9PEZI|nr:hypothetical protein B0T16DRAFT_460313 [Cercophora newfieldiana]
MIAGLFGNQISSNFNCSSTCSWSRPFTTLGFHHECRNITAETLATKKCVAVRNGGLVEVDDSEPGNHNCTLETSSKIRLFSNLVYTSIWTGFFFNGGAIPFPLNNTDFENDPQSLLKSPNIFTAVQYSIQRNEENGDEIYGEDIQECTVSVAAHTYSDIRASGNEISIGYHNITSSRLSVEFMAAGDGGLGGYVFSAPAWAFSNKVDLSVAVTARGLNASLNDMVHGMTQRIAVGASQQLAIGSVIERVVFVEAWYPMLVVPIFVTVMTLVLLIFTMWTSRASTGTALGKTSALVHQIRPSDDPRLTGGALRCDYGDLNELQRATRNLKVQKVD